MQEVAPKLGFTSSAAASVPFAFQQDVLKDIAQGQDSLKMTFLVNDDKSMNSGFPYGVENGIQTIMRCTCVNTGEILGESVRHGALMSNHLLPNALTVPHRPSCSNRRKLRL